MTSTAPTPASVPPATALPEPEWHDAGTLAHRFAHILADWPGSRRELLAFLLVCAAGHTGQTKWEARLILNGDPNMWLTWAAGWLDAGLVTRTLEYGPRGRPSYRYHATPKALALLSHQPSEPTTAEPSLNRR